MASMDHGFRMTPFRDRIDHFQCEQLLTITRHTLPGGQFQTGKNSLVRLFCRVTHPEKCSADFSYFLGKKAVFRGKQVVACALLNGQWHEMHEHDRNRSSA